jgi:putative oxidoreductase
MNDPSSRNRDLALLGLRIGLGLLFIHAGWGKISNIAGVVGLGDRLHLPLPAVFGPVLAIVELGGGFLIIGGLLTRLVALLLALDMLGALFLVKIHTSVAMWTIQRLLAMREPPPSYLPNVWGRPKYGWDTIETHRYRRVDWPIQIPVPGPLHRHTFSIDALHVDVPPRCPKCRTELEESRRFPYGFSWKCVGCGFKTHNNECIRIEALT